MALYLRHLPDGNLIDTLRTDTPPKDPAYILVSDPEQISLIQRDPKRVLFRNSRVEPKTEIRLEWNKQEHIAGKEVALVTMHNIPAGYATVRVRVAGQEADLPVGETIEIESPNPGHIGVQVVEPTLYSEQLILRFLPES